MKDINRLLIIMCVVFISILGNVYAQVSENFSDGDFTANPVWTGDDAEFIVNGTFELQLNASVAGRSYLSTPSGAIENAVWEFRVKINNTTSSANLSEVYLVSNTANIEGSLNGYFVRIGNTADEVSLYKQTGSTKTMIIDGTDGTVITSANDVMVKVTRDVVGNWELLIDNTGGTTYTSQGIVFDDTHLSSSFFGLTSLYSVSNITKYLFDDITVTGSSFTDNIPPTIDSLVVISSTEVDVYFSENLDQTSAETINNYSIDNSIGNPSTAMQDGSDLSLIHLTFSTAFSNGTTYILSISNVADENANPISTTNESFFYFIEVPTEKKDIVFNEIFPDPSPVIGLPGFEFVEVFNASNKIFNLKDWSFVNSTTVKTVSKNVYLLPDSFVIFCSISDTSLFKSYGLTYGISSWTTLTNTGDSLTLKDKNDKVIDWVSYKDSWYRDDVKNDGGYSLELINPTLPCGNENNWIASNDISGGTPGEINSVLNNTPDIIAPTISSYSLLSADSIRVVFSETLDSLSLTTSTYSISGGLTIDNEYFSSALNSVTLGLSAAIDTAVNYTISITGATDCAGNNLTSVVNFIIGYSPEKDSIIINEIYPDSSPSVGLPVLKFEYAEIFNRSSKFYDLSGCELSGASFPNNTFLAPGEHMILCSPSDTASFGAYGKYAGMSGWSSSFLTNDGKDLQLIKQNGIVIDRVFYDISWYKDASKDDGGWSLERINPYSSCTGVNNWRASVSSIGGTPGSENSVFSELPDNTAPSINSIQILSDSSLQLYFSEVMDSLSLVNGIFTVDNGVSVTSLYVDAFLQEMTLFLSPKMDTSVFYLLNLSGLSDCPGNTFSSSHTIVVGYAPEKDSIIINEIYPDPTPSVGLPDFEYAEIFNRSSKFYDLSGCEFTGTYFPSNTFLAPGEHLILCSPNDTASFGTYGKYAGMSGWSSSFLTNSGKDLQLTKVGGSMIDEVSYEISWYNDAAKDDGGWSLERVNPFSTCNGAGNWKASTALVGGTPGSENSVFSDLPDNTAPTVSSIQMLSDSSIQLYFSEVMDSLSLVNGGYTVNNGISVSSFAIDASLQEMTLFLSPKIDTATYYLLTISGLSDCPGNVLTTSNHQFFVAYKPFPGEILITEIFADPTPEVGLPAVEYVEIFNATNKLFDLSTCRFSNATFLLNAVIEPNQYLILCSVNDTLDLIDYNPKTGVNVWPALVNSGENLVLTNEDDQIIDEVNYNIGFYGNSDKDDGGWSMERVNLLLDCNYSNNWKASNYYLGGTPGWQNSVFSTLPDTAKPTILDVVVTSDTTISVYFSEPMDSSSLNISTISFENFINAESASMKAEDEFKVLNITVTPSLIIGDYYTLVLSTNGKDCSGNILNGHKFTFIRGDKPTKGDLIINEIFSDQSPIVGLPEAEFVEIYNRSDKLIDLNGVEFEGAEINKVMLFPGEYLIICDHDDANSFTSFGKVASNNSSSTLTNSGEDIRLTYGNIIIDRVIYSDDWFEDEVKKGGGWTLERINPQTDCNFSNNWAESSDATGGTPGRINSVHSLNADVTAPGIEKIWVLSSNLIQVNFTESMDSVKLLSANYSFTPFNGIDSLSYAALDYTSIFITLTEALTVGVENTLSISNLSDCEGNEIANPSSRKFVMPENGDAGDLIINEVLFAPNSGSDDFVEIYNHSEKYINLSKWKITNADFIDDSTDYKNISLVQVVLEPKGYIVITKDSNDIKFNYPNSKTGRFVQVESLPSYNNSDGTVILLNNENTIADRFDYEDNMHFSLLNTTNGVSLERLDFDRETNEKTNWHSAAEDAGFATPGYQNSQYKETEDSNDEVSLEPEIFSPDNDGYNDVLNISYKFSEAGNVATILIFDTRGRMVRTLKQNELLGMSGTFSWDGILDNTEKARVGAYVVYLEVFDAAGNVKHFKEPCVVATKF